MMETAVLAGERIWDMQQSFRAQPGVVVTQLGCAGGELVAPSYQDHSTHAEAIEIIYHPARTDYRTLLEFFLQVHEPTAPEFLGNDGRLRFRSAIFCMSDEQQRTAEAVIAGIKASGMRPGKVVTEVVPAGIFWEAEPEHQGRLRRYPNGCTCPCARPT